MFQKIIKSGKQIKDEKTVERVKKCTINGQKDIISITGNVNEFKNDTTLKNIYVNKKNIG